MIVPTDLLLSVVRLPISLASYPDLAKTGWELLSFTISRSLVKPLIELPKDLASKFSELYELAKNGYTGMKTDFSSRLDIIPLPELEEHKAAYKAARQIIDTPFVYAKNSTVPIDPYWVLYMLQLEQIVTQLELHDMEPELA